MQDDLMEGDRQIELLEHCLHALRTIPNQRIPDTPWKTTGVLAEHLMTFLGATSRHPCPGLIYASGRPGALTTGQWSAGPSMTRERLLPFLDAGDIVAAFLPDGEVSQAWIYDGRRLHEMRRESGWKELLPEARKPVRSERHNISLPSIPGMD